MKKSSSTYDTKKLDKALKKLVKDTDIAAAQTVTETIVQTTTKLRTVSFDEVEVLPYVDIDTGKLVIVSDTFNEGDLILATEEAIDTAETLMTQRLKEVLG